MNGIMKRRYGNCMTTDRKLRRHNITSKADLLYSSETWAINKKNAPKRKKREQDRQDF